MAAVGFNQSQLALYSHVRQSTISDWLSGKKRPQPDSLQRIARPLKVSFEEALAAAAGDYSRAVSAISPSVKELRPHYSFGEAVSALERFALEMVEIPVGEISAGPGAWTDLTFYLPRSLVGSHRVVGYHVRGVSMAPLVPDGSIVVVDLDIEPREGDMVVAWTEDGGVVKRYQDGQLAGNNGKSIPVTEAVRIEGVVISVTTFFR
ncbi:MAG TPA: helix-turn-helix domain-containing protein [Dehalococcoidia bacterium]|nr:helix-turn-helix domain-containing protein [Dehalococcoidia bacterium]